MQQDHDLISDGPFAGLRRGYYRTAMVDVPWKYVMYSKKGEGKSPTRHYHCMNLDEVEALPVGDLLAEDATLLMWVPDGFLPHGIRIAEGWGFTYKTVGYYWVKTTVTGKEHFGQGYWTRANPEQCLLLTRGRPPRLAKNVRRLITTDEDPTDGWEADLIVSKVREHSRKPDEAFERTERLVGGPYLELFSRQRRPGWTVWGNEIDKFVDPVIAALVGIPLPDDVRDLI